MYLRRKRKRRITLIKLLFICMLVAWLAFTVRGIEEAGNSVSTSYKIPIE